MAANGQGVLFKNDKKSQPNHPDYTGNFTLTKELAEALLQEIGTGKEIRVQLAAWIKSGQKGKYLSVSVSAPFKKSGAAQTSRRSSFDEEDPPF